MPELTPRGEDVTVPVPVPFLVTVTKNGAGAVTNVAVTAAVVESVHAPVPVQPPPFHPENTDPAAGVAVRVSVVPGPNWELQVEPQVMPVGDEVTKPVPVPPLSTVTVKEARLSTAA